MASGAATSLRVGSGGPLTGEMTVPGDKSVSHRAVMLGSIADGTTEVAGLLEGEDNLSTIRAFRRMGVAIERPGPGRLTITGAGMRGLKEPADVIDAGNSGTTARILMGLLAAQPFFSVLTGDDSLRKRPIGRVVEPLTEMGSRITGREGSTLLPLAVSGGGLRGITYRTPVASAQLKSAILMAGLYAEGETTVIEPGPSRDHTERMLSLFGAEVERDGNTVTVRPPAGLAGTTVEVPGDISSAAFFLVGGAIQPGSELVIKNVGVNPTRVGILAILEKMGCRVDRTGERDASGEPVADLVVRSGGLKGVEISGEELLPAIDEFPAICVAAAFAEGTTRITGAGELRVKESDRISAMAELLGCVEVQVEESQDGIIIDGMGPRTPRGGGTVKTRGDHRVAMAAAMAGLRCAGGLAIEDPGCVDVSFPGFFDTLRRVTLR